MTASLLSEELRESFIETLRRLRIDAQNLDGLSVGLRDETADVLRNGFLRWHDDIEGFFFNHLSDPPELPMSIRYRALLEGTVPKDQMYRVMNGERRRVLLLLSAVEQDVAVSSLPDGSVKSEIRNAAPEVIPENEPPLVFISHSSEDKARFVVPFATRLRENGVNAWLDRWEMLPGDSLVQRIFAEGIGRARAVIAVVSHESAKSAWVKEELNVATVRKIGGATRLIVIRLDKAEIPAPLSDVLWEDIDPGADWTDGLDRILRAIFEVPSRPPLGPPPAFVRQSFGIRSTQIPGEIDSVSLTEAAETTATQTTASSTLALVKLGITDGRYRIRMEEAVKGLVDSCVQSLSKESYPWQVADLTNDNAPTLVQERLEAMNQDIAGLATVLATGIYYGDTKHDNLWTRPIVRITNSTEEGRPQHWQNIWSEISRYPALRLFYTAGVAAVAASRESMLGKLMHLGPFAAAGAPEPRELWKHLDLRRVMDHDLMKAMPRWNGTNYYHAASLILRTATRPTFGDLLDDAEFSQCFERFECLRSMQELDLGKTTALGEFAWYAANGRSAVIRTIKNEITTQREAWPLVRAGEFGASADRALEAAEALNAEVSRRDYF